MLSFIWGCLAHGRTSAITDPHTVLAMPPNTITTKNALTNFKVPPDSGAALVKNHFTKIKRQVRLVYRQHKGKWRMSQQGGEELDSIVVVVAVKCYGNHQRILRRKQHDLMFDFKMSLLLLCTRYIIRVQEKRNRQNCQEATASRLEKDDNTLYRNGENGYEPTGVFRIYV